MNIRFHSALVAAAIGAALCAPGAQAAVSVIGGGPAELCYQAADAGKEPIEYLAYCSAALKGSLTEPDRAATYVNRGVLRLAMNDVDAAAADFKAGLAINVLLGEAYVDLAATEITRKHYADAIAHINKGLSLGTKEPEAAYYDRAMADEALGNLRAAYDDFHEAATIAPDFEQATRELKRFKIVDKPSGT